MVRFKASDSIRSQVVKADGLCQLDLSSEVFTLIQGRGSGPMTAARGREFIHTSNGSYVCIREAQSDRSKIKQVWALACLIITPSKHRL